MNNTETPTCKYCVKFHVPIHDRQWKYIGFRVGECTGRLPFGTLRPAKGSMTAAIEDQTGRLKGGGVILVDEDFGCINFDRLHITKA